MQKQTNKRWRLLADIPFQGTLCLRIAVYWILCQAACVLTLLGLASLDATADSIYQQLIGFLPMALIISGCLLPVVLLDVVAFTNRTSGPLHNFRRKFEQLADGELTDELRFRGSDRYRDLEKNYNKLLLQLRHQHEIQSIETDTTEKTTNDGELVTNS